jgi:hypothetical protein
MILKIQIGLKADATDALPRRFRRPFAAGRVADVPARGSRRGVESSAADSGKGAR